MTTQIENLLQAGAHLQVRREVDRLLLEGRLTVSEEATVLRLACRASINLGDYYAAVKLGDRAVERAIEANDPNALGFAHFDLGVAYTYIGDAYLAKGSLEQFLALYPTLPRAESLAAKAHYYLSLLHRQFRQWHASINSLQQAATLAHQTGQMKLRTKCASDLAWCYLMLGAESLAVPYLVDVENYLSQDIDDEIAADLWCHRALSHRLAGDLVASVQLCQEVFVPGRAGVTSHHLGAASWIMGENALDLGRHEEAAIFAETALDHAARDNWPSLMNLASGLKRRIAGRSVA